MLDIDKIYEQDFETVYKFLFCLTHDSNLSEELTQETFYRAIQRINTFKGNSKMSVWLCQIAKNIWYNELKKNKKVQILDDKNLFFLESEDNVEDIVIKQNDREELYKLLKKLDKQTQNVIYLRITGNLSFKEIAEILNKTETWARVTFYRGKKKLKEGNYDERKERL